MAMPRINGRIQRWAGDRAAWIAGFTAEIIPGMNRGSLSSVKEFCSFLYSGVFGRILRPKPAEVPTTALAGLHRFGRKKPMVRSRRSFARLRPSQNTPIFQHHEIIDRIEVRQGRYRVGGPGGF